MSRGRTIKEGRKVKEKTRGNKEEKRKDYKRIINVNERKMNAGGKGEMQKIVKQ